MGARRCPPCCEEAVTCQWFITKTTLSPDGGMHRVHPAKQVLPDKGNWSSVVGSSKSLAWGAGGLRVQRLWQPLTNPPTLPWLERKKGRRMPGGTGQKQKSRDRIYSYEHVTLLLLVFIPWEGQRFLLKNCFPVQIRTECGSFQLGSPSSKQRPSGWCVPFNPHRYMVISSQGWVRWAFQGCTMGSGWAVSWKDITLPQIQSTEDFRKLHKI